jgi:hypothetical protein
MKPFPDMFKLNNFHTIFKGEWSLNQISLDIFTGSNFLIKRLKISQLIEKFDQVKKSISSFLAVWQKFLLMSFWVILKFWSTEKSQKIQSSDQICISSLLKLLINWKMTISIKWISVKWPPVYLNPTTFIQY